MRDPRYIQFFFHCVTLYPAEARTRKRASRLLVSVSRIEERRPVHPTQWTSASRPRLIASALNLMQVFQITEYEKVGHEEILIQH